jgi:hypothetical protein
VQPVLQGQNGNFVGTVSTQQGSLMVSFDQSGNLQWSLPGAYQPQVATEDGGVIATSGSGVTIAFDQNGNAIEQLASLPTQSWTGSNYQLGSVESVLSAAHRLARSFWPIIGGNNSGNNTALPQEQFAQLDSCIYTNLKPPPACPGVREAIWNGEKSLEPVTKPLLVQS